jgi:Fe-coproporphyrin III synthase
MNCARRPRILQIHPSRRCNLTCRHCYTESSPRIREELPEHLVVDLVQEAAREGYNYLAVSGGEPLMWRGLASVLGTARAAGMAATLTTNATIVTPHLARELAKIATYVAVSVDGSRESHDLLRGAGTFERMQRGVSMLRDAGVSIGMIWTLTQRNAHELEDVYRYAKQVRAAFVQIHPLEGVGYAARELVDEVPDFHELIVAGLFAADVRDVAGQEIPIYLDATSSADLPGHVVPDVDPEGPLAALVDPLVLRADGSIVPGNYALPMYWAIGCIHDAPLSCLAKAWRKEGLARWRALVNATIEDLPREEQLVNFGARLLPTAYRLLECSDGVEGRVVDVASLLAP